MSVESSSSNGWWMAFSPIASRKTNRERDGISRVSDDGDLMVTVAGVALELGFVVVTSYVASILISKLLKNVNNPLDSEENEAALTAAEKRLAALLERDGRKKEEMPVLTNYERQISQDVIDPNDIPIHFSDIGGIDDIKQELYELAVLPLQRPDLFSTSHLLQQPGGILLYGPPGTGKTMLAKAIAKEANATFIAVKLSKIMNKWFGESNKLIDAIFSLARKLAPSIIFVDELDTFLNPRDGSENSAGNAIKAEFLTLWDGITTRQDEQPVMVLGATNRPNQVDSAILRRLPRLFRIELPKEEGRLQILKLTLKDHPLDDSAKAYLPQLAKVTVGYSGSDLKELCHCAALESVREVMKEHSREAVMSKKPRNSLTNKTKKGKSKKTGVASSSNPSNSESSKSPLRPMSKRDLVVAQMTVKRTGQDAAEYERRQSGDLNQNYNKNGQPNQELLQGLMALSRLLSSQSLGEAPVNNTNPNGTNASSDDHRASDDIPDIL